MKIAPVGAGAVSMPDAASEPNEDSEAPSPGAQAVAVGVLAVIALVAALYLARAFFVPLLIGILASYALRPVVDWLEGDCACRAAWRGDGAGRAGRQLVLGRVLAERRCRGDDREASRCRAQAAAEPERCARQARRRRCRTCRKPPTSSRGRPPRPPAEEEAGGTRTRAQTRSRAHRWLRDYMLAQSALLITVAAQAPIVLLLTYFLLASGEHFRRKLVRSGRAVADAQEGRRADSRGDRRAGPALPARHAGVERAGRRRHLARIQGAGNGAGGRMGRRGRRAALHSLPRAGTAGRVASGVAAFLQFGSLLDALAVAGASLLVAGAIGFVFMTWLQSRFARVNAAVLFIALLFFGWLWGVWGLLLGAPLVAIAKVVCDRVESLKPAGELLGR